MGTRADFYVGHGPDAVWLGSVAWDGYKWHEGEERSGFGLCACSEEAAYRAKVCEILAHRKDATRAEDGWPWPWKDSNTTDYAYVFDGGKVHVYVFGSPVDDQDAPERTDWPDMSRRAKNPPLGSLKSGIIVLGGD